MALAREGDPAKMLKLCRRSLNCHSNTHRIACTHGHTLNESLDASRANVSGDCHRRAPICNEVRLGRSASERIARVTRMKSHARLWVVAWFRWIVCEFVADNVGLCVCIR